VTDDAADAADALVARAIESVLDAVPAIPGDEVAADLAKYQPWADTAAPTGRNKRPLEALLDELRERVEAEPDALAAQPSGRRPAVAYFDRFGGARREGAAGQPAGKRRRRGRPAGAAAEAAGTPRSVEERPAPSSGQGRAGDGGGDAGSRRRRRRRGGRGRSGGGPGQGGA
jgi:hypothetical protein